MRKVIAVLCAVGMFLCIGVLILELYSIETGSHLLGDEKRESTLTIFATVGLLLLVTFAPGPVKKPPH